MSESKKVCELKPNEREVLVWLTRKSELQQIINTAECGVNTMKKVLSSEEEKLAKNKSEFEALTKRLSGKLGG